MGYLSTGKAAKLLSVSPDTVLKWVKSGKLPAIKTAGGHHRISCEAINALIYPEKSDTRTKEFSGKQECDPDVCSGKKYKTRHTVGMCEQQWHLTQEQEGKTDSIVDKLARSILYCWEYFGGTGEVGKICRNCLVYKACALKCYEMSYLTEGVGKKGANSCEACTYYRYQVDRPYKVLVISDNAKWQNNLHREKGKKTVSFQFTCSNYTPHIIDSFRPDFIAVNLATPNNSGADICKRLFKDPGLSGAKIILVTPTPPSRLAMSYPGTIRMRHSYFLKDLENYLSDTQVCYSLQQERRGMGK